MSTRLTLLLSLILIFVTLLAGVFLWNQLPDQMASHWNEQDQVDGYVGKFWGAFMVPLMMIGLTLLFLAIPSIDPLKKNIADFRGLFNLFIVLFNGFMAYVHGLTLAWNLGNTGFRMSTLLLPALGLLFILVGLVTRKAKRNYFIGIRTPWTLANDTVWEKTHKLGGLLFIAAGVISLFGIFLPEQAFLLMLVPVIAAAVISYIYSYILFRQEEKKLS
jgi:uncharacterized membrane protein